MGTENARFGPARRHLRNSRNLAGGEWPASHSTWAWLLVAVLAVKFDVCRWRAVFNAQGLIDMDQ